MAVELIFITLMAVSVAHSSDLPPNCYKQFTTINCTISGDKTMEIVTDGFRVNIRCGTAGKEPVMIDLRTIPKLNVDQAFRDVSIANCTIPHGYSFGALFEHVGIRDEIRTFEGVNIGSSLKGRFSSGFENLDALVLRKNRNLRLDEHDFRSLSKLSELALSRNDITDIPANVFHTLGELKILKLNWNKLKVLPAGVFAKQRKLTVLNLDNNRLHDVTKEMLEGLESLNVLSLERNRFEMVQDDVFQNISALRQIYFGNGNIDIPYNIFASNYRLNYVRLLQVKIPNGLNLSNVGKLQIKWSEIVNISGLSNIETISITEIPESLIHPLAVNSFANQSAMTILNLSANKLTTLSDGLFYGLNELTCLQLSDNHLTNISGLIFRDLQNLIEIDLSNNHLVTIHPNAFANATQLQTVNLKNNQLSFSDPRSPFMHLNKLNTLNLFNNNLTRMPSHLIKMEELKELDLGRNHITSFKYSELRETNIQLSSTLDIRLAPESSVRIYLNDNPLVCDCSMYSFLSGKDDQLSHAFAYNCGISKYDLKPCPSQASTLKRCPAACTCSERNTEQGHQTIIFCEGKKLTSVPLIENVENATAIELNISNNSLTELPIFPSNSNVIVIQASHNQISNIKPENLPANLRALDVSHNRIQTISADILHRLKNQKYLEIILLRENPWSCDCSKDTEELIALARENNSITDLQQVTCKVSSYTSYELSSDFLIEYCAHNLYMQVSIVLTVLAFIVGLAAALFYKYQKFIKVWLYAHNACLWWVDEEYVDRDMLYDAFVSYSHLDDDFVHRLSNELEKNGNPRFRLCIHERDFVGGEEIEKAIARSLDVSRRTIIILSKNYLNSVWTLHEFHLAYKKSIAEKRNRLIVVKCGDIGDVGTLDSTIQSYVKTFTYIDWNDRWFWEKIRYALPHRRS